ncbi:MAG: ABC transporter substrate-binding protein [Nitriliruptoraceae bacterium]
MHLRSHPSRLSTARPLVAGLTAALVLAACGGSSEDPGVDTAADGDADEAASGDTDDADGFPVTLTNCDREVTFERPPERILVLGRAELVSIISELDQMDRIVGRAGAYPPEYFDDETNDLIADIPSLSDDLDESGHLQISQEAILDLEPDLVLGRPDGVDVASLEAAGIPLLEQPANCPGGIEDIGFETIYDEVTAYGDILGVPDQAAQVVAELQDRVADVEAAAAEVGDGRVAAALYPTVGGGTTYAYGNRSFPHVLLETAGFDNAFADTDERVFEVATEELISRDPDALVLLHVDGEPGPVADALTQLPGASGMTAVVQEQVLVQLFNFAEYPSPLVIDGLEQLVATFGDRA